MTLITGVSLVVMFVVFILYSLPRRGKLAPFIGTFLEGPLVLGMVGCLFLGFVLVIAGWPQRGKVIQ